MWSEEAKRGEVEDEGYWKALLGEGMFAPSAGGEETVHPQPGGSEAETPLPGLERDWQAAERALASGDLLELLADGCNRGGLLVTFGALRGFVPYSQLSGMPQSSSSEERMRALEGRVGQRLKLQVVEVDRSRRRLIFSERAALEGLEADDLLSRLRPGDICTGMVTRIRPFGAFVDLGGVEGLIHVSELSWGWVAHPSDILRPGDEVKVYVIGVNQEERKVALSLRRLRPDPWSLVDERYSVGQLVQGVITNVVSFGAFMQLEEGLEGLIHVSELAYGNFLHPRAVVQEGDEVTARILEIDSANRRLALSLRQAHGRNAQSSEVEGRQMEFDGRSREASSGAKSER